MQSFAPDSIPIGCRTLRRRRILPGAINMYPDVSPSLFSKYETRRDEASTRQRSDVSYGQQRLLGWLRRTPFVVSPPLVARPSDDDDQEAGNIEEEPDTNYTHENHEDL